ncbi:Rare lipoprotein A [Catenulispora acidiphila DSM 44928]|uniref:Rare lipoprotein A n=1 Tax=Catenulispora acidiphila (strain DSM 44928 / JCM 14897 / NBRC 102108 / NRRL B-24433 / ID139908) TaxID=479433 RepID=C7Q384_CATAD|nr:Rare lipoprotein A [Catenulispora acidiphila DSM 44928]
MQGIRSLEGEPVKATHPTTHRSRWLPISTAAGLLVVAGLIAGLAMGSSSRHTADPPPAATGFATTGSGMTATPNSAPTSAEPSAPAVASGTASSASSPTVAAAHKTPGKTSTTSQTSATPTHGGAPSPTATSLAGRVQPGVTYQGVATEYSAADGDGACLFGPAADMMIAAMNELDYQNSEACGAHVLVRAANGATITVLITNECPYPCAPGQLDLSQQAFAKLADPKAGRISVTWQLVSPAAAGNVSIRYKVGSSQYWCGIQVIGERNPVARLEVAAGSGWQQLPRASYNYFLSANGAGCGKAVRITDIFGQQVTTAALPVEPDVIQPAGVQFSRH